MLALNSNVLSCCRVIGWLASCVNKQPNNLPKKSDCVFNNYPTSFPVLHIFPTSFLFPQENVMVYSRLPINSSPHEAPSSRTTELLSNLTDNMHLLFIHNSKRQWSGFTRKLEFAWRKCRRRTQAGEHRGVCTVLSLNVKNIPDIQDPSSVPWSQGF